MGLYDSSEWDDEVGRAIEGYLDSVLNKANREINELLRKVKSLYEPFEYLDVGSVTGASPLENLRLRGLEMDKISFEAELKELRK